MSRENGGQAFPVESDAFAQLGMTRRDYFAAKALQGICASGPGADCNNDFIAREAYGLADAMLAARSA